MAHVRNRFTTNIVSLFLRFQKAPSFHDGMLSPPTKVAHALLSFFTGDANGAGNLLCAFGFASFLLTSVQVTWSIQHMHLTLENLWYFIQKPLGPELIYHYLDYPDHSP